MEPASAPLIQTSISSAGASVKTSRWPSSAWGMTIRVRNQPYSHFLPHFMPVGAGTNARFTASP